MVRAFADALPLLPQRLGPQAAPLTDSLIAADRYGLPLAPVLDRLADEARQHRRRLADASARQLPVRCRFRSCCAPCRRSCCLLSSLCCLQPSLAQPLGVPHELDDPQNQGLAVRGGRPGHHRVRGRLLGAALIVLLVIGWATTGGGSDKVGELFDTVIESVIDKL